MRFVMVCEELKERTTQNNIDLGFNTFCNKTKVKNINDFMRVGYISTQYNALIQRGGLLPDTVALSIVAQFLADYKEAGHMDILNRQDEFVFNED